MKVRGQIVRFFLWIERTNHRARMKWFGEEDPPPSLSDKILGGFTSRPNMVRRFRFLIVLFCLAVLIALLVKVA